MSIRSFALRVTAAVATVLIVALTSSKAPAAGAPGHLYVADYGGGTISRFPIDRRGMPAARPDLVLRGGLRHPVGIAVDAHGDIYATNYNPGSDVISEFAPGAHGDAKPIRTLSLPKNLSYRLDVGPGGELYVQDLLYGAVDVFAPGAHGKERPLHRITNWNPHAARIEDVSVDGGGRLFVSVYGEGIYVYDDPLHRWRIPSRILHESLPAGAIPGYGPTALDEAGAHIYSIFSLSQKQTWGNADFAAIGPPGDSGLNSLLFTADCKGGAYAAAISGRYLLVSCSGSPPTILVYRKDLFGRQPAVNAIGSFVSPAGIRLF